jgi:carboxyl-terminal processing protease
VPQAGYQSTGRIKDALLTQLRARSAERVGGNADFGKLANDVARYKKRKDEKTISLVESEFEKQWNEGKAAEDEEEKKLEELEAQKRPVVRRDYYFDEAMNVTVDFLQAAGAPGIAGPAPANAIAPRQSAEVVRPAVVTP